MEKSKESNKFLTNCFQGLFENMPSCCFVYTPINNGSDFLILDLNNAAEKIEQVTKENIIGKNVKEIFPGIIEFGLFDVFLRVWKTGTPEHFPVKLYKDERVNGWKENYVYKISSGEIVVVYNDVTEQKKMEEELKRTREDYKEVLENNIDGIIVLDSVGEFVWVNRSALKMFEIENIENLKDKNIFNFIDNVSINEAVEDFKTVMSGKKEGFLKEYVTISSSGKKYWVESVGRKTNFMDKEVDWITFRDVTKRKEAEEKLKIKIEELEKLNKLMIGRELKMIELKNELKKSEEKLLEINR